MKRKIDKAQNLSRMCVVCGVDNGLGLRGHFYELESGEVLGVFHPRPEHQGYPERMHGGLISAILDETIGRAINILEPDTWGVTVDFTVKFRKPVPLDSPVKALGRLDGDPRRLFEGSGEIVLEDGTVAAEGRGRYLQVPLREITDPSFRDREWFEDPESPPLEVEI